MSVIRKNIISNVAGRGWTALLALAVVPIHIHFLGIEAYGLIGFFMSVMAILSLLDLGLGTALNRQFAQYSIQPDKAQEMHDLLRTLEIIYWLIGIAIATTMAILAPATAAYWIKSQQLTTETVTQALTMMGIAVAFQWPRTLYAGGLMGVQRQAAYNLLSSITITVSSIGGVLVIWQVSPSIQALVAWSIAIGLADTLLTGLLLRRSLPESPARPTFSTRLLKDIWRFAAGMTGISVMSVILTQVDKMILVKVLPLDAFGYYNLASRVAAGLYFLINPVSAAFFPRFSQLLLIGDRQELVRLYHRACQLMSAAVLPVTIVLAFFAADFLLLWTRNAAIVANSSMMLALLATGTAINGLMNLPVTLQLASGGTRLVFYTHSVTVILLGPFIYFMSSRYGGLGAAWVWLVLNCGYVAFFLPIIHRRLLPGQLRDWFVIDVGAPLAAALTVAVIWRQVTGTADSQGWMLVNLAAVSLLTLLAATLAAPQIRALLLRQLPGKTKVSEP
ncbi:MAG TPA: oligosaccharide flippase family protein [Burkholderiales bacterium]|nr:oligosaccharide flippase family protein [Burkholderiales bacterium]